jgi:hypothetical protein
MIYNARPEQTFRDIIPEPLRCGATAFIGESGKQRLCGVRWQQCRNRYGWLAPTRIPVIVSGMPDYAGETPRDDVGHTQIGLGEHDQRRSILAERAKIHLPHQPAEKPRAVALDA